MPCSFPVRVNRALAKGWRVTVWEGGRLVLIVAPDVYDSIKRAELLEEPEREHAIREALGDAYVDVQDRRAVLHMPEVSDAV